MRSPDARVFPTNPSILEAPPLTERAVRSEFLLFPLPSGNVPSRLWSSMPRPCLRQIAIGGNPFRHTDGLISQSSPGRHPPRGLPIHFAIAGWLEHNKIIFRSFCTRSVHASSFRSFNRSACLLLLFWSNAFLASSYSLACVSRSSLI